MKTLTSLLLSLICFSVFAQKSDSTIIRSRNIRDWFVEHYTVQKTNKKIKNGFAEVLFNGQQIASGQYKDDLRTGLWKFYLLNGQTEQIYNYTDRKVEFETKNNTTSYQIDNVKEGDEIINPVKIGGSYAAILVMGKISNYVVDLRYKKGTYTVNYIYYLDSKGTVYQVELKITGNNYNKTKNIDLKLFKAEELEFTPSYVNKTPVNSSFIISSNLIIN